MHCNRKMMIKGILFLGAALLVAYIALPQFRTLVPGVAPSLLALLYPLPMFFMNKDPRVGALPPSNFKIR